MKKNKIKFIFSTILLFFAVLLLFAANWAIRTFDFTFEEFFFYLNVPMNGANMKSFISFFIYCFFPAALIICVIVLLFKVKKEVIIKNIKIFPIKFNDNIYLIVSLLLFIISLYFGLNKIGAIEYFKTQTENSLFIEENYVDSSKVKLIFPEKKKNLIYIYVESLEPTYLLKSDGGYQSDNLMPYLTSVSKKYINFSHNNLIGGAYTVPGVSWTVAGIVAQTSGLPLKIPIDGNSYGSFNTFLPGAYTLGEILNENGYNQMFMIGSDAMFGGRDSYLSQHGKYDIYDYYTAIENGKFDSDYHVWWGYEDEKLFNYAKEEIINLASKEEPFNFSMLTVDSHFPDGYLSSECTTLFDLNLSNVMNCTDNKLKKFVTWIQEQEFYENTTIVIVGDHTSMDSNYFKDVSDDYERTTYNLFINSSVNTENLKNRKFTTMDLFPTTLASIGVEIEGDRLALGTNLFSSNKTLVEEYGVDYVRDELNKKSTFYTNKLIYGK